MRQSLLLVAGGALLLAGCGSDGWFGEAEDPPLPGERIAVLALTGALEGDPEAAQRPMRLPEPASNPDWPQAGGTPFHAIGHPALGSVSTAAWSTLHRCWIRRRQAYSGAARRRPGSGVHDGCRRLGQRRRVAGRQYNMVGRDPAGG